MIGCVAVQQGFVHDVVRLMVQLGELPHDRASQRGVSIWIVCVVPRVGERMVVRLKPVLECERMLPTVVKSTTLNTMLIPFFQPIRFV